MLRRHALRRLGTALLGAPALPVVAGACSTAAAPARPAWPPAAPADDERFWASVRANYPLTRERVYFNTGGLGPAPYPVLDAMHATVMELQRISETGHGKLAPARVAVAAFIGCAPEALAFMRNATEATSTIASGFKGMGPGDEVIFESHAHPGGFIPWMSRARQQGIVCRMFEPDPTSAAGNVARIERLITPRTKVIQVSHVTAPTGIRMPVEAIAEVARRRGIWFHVDGAQSVGMFPVNVTAIGCDSFAASCHKWMNAPHGTGLLYIRPNRLDEIAPTEVGAYSDAGVTLPDRLTYTPTAVRYEPGTRDVSSVVGVQAAVAFLSEIGMDRVAAHGQGLAQRAQAGLRAIPGIEVLTPADPALSGSITTFRSATVPYDRMIAYLGSAHKLRTRTVTEVGLNGIRVSTHVYNNAAEVDRLIAGVRQGQRDA
jgi:selenocysteine lyase/cysteine desulfurase